MFVDYLLFLVIMKNFHITFDSVVCISKALNRIHPCFRYFKYYCLEDEFSYYGIFIDYCIMLHHILTFVRVIISKIALLLFQYFYFIM